MLNVDPGPFFWAAVETADGKYAQKLFNDLFEDYSNALRPVEDTDKVLNVTLQITLSQIKDMVSNSHNCLLFFHFTLNMGIIFIKSTPKVPAYPPLLFVSYNNLYFFLPSLGIDFLLSC